MENDYLRRNLACGKRTNSDEDELFQELSLNIDFGLGTLNISNVGQEDIR
jgi:hypothetical protein